MVSKTIQNPFGKFSGTDYFKCIEFEHRGSQHAYIFISFVNDHRKAVGKNMQQTVKLILEEHSWAVYVVERVSLRNIPRMWSINQECAFELINIRADPDEDYTALLKKFYLKC